MGIPASLGINGFGTPVTGDQATAVVSGSFIARGVSVPFAFFGRANFTLYCQVTDTLTTTAGSFTATVSGATAALITDGTAIRSSLFENGTVFSAFSAGSGTLFLQPISVRGIVTPLSDIVTGNFPTDGLVSGTDLTGAAISGFGIQPGTTISEIITHSNQLFGTPAKTPNQAVIRLSLPATDQPSPVITNIPTPHTPTELTIIPTANMIGSGVDSAALFTGASIAYVGSVQLEKSFDGGATWIVANIGPPGSGALAVYQNASSVSFSLYEPEKQVLYRWNCTALTLTGTESIQYRISETGSLNLSSHL